MHSVNAKILSIKNRVITIRVPDTALAKLPGKEAKLNGLSAACLNCLPSKEADDDEGELTNALVYRIEGADDISSLTQASICEVTWL